MHVRVRFIMTHRVGLSIIITNKWLLFIISITDIQKNRAKGSYLHTCYNIRVIDLKLPSVLWLHSES